MSNVTPFHRTIAYIFPLIGLFIGLATTARGMSLPATPVMIASWQNNPEPDVESYTIHYGTQPHALNYSTNVGRDTRFEFRDLEPGTVYYCAVVAKNTAGMESERSDVATFIFPQFDASLPFADGWLLGHGFDATSPMDFDHNGDGVTLLASYALNLNPHDNPVAGMPRAQVAGNRLELRFFAGRDDVNYRVESSPDMKTWSTSKVTLGALDSLLHRTGSIPLGGTERFLRLVLVR